MSKSPRELVREFLQAEFAPRARSVRARTVWFAWSATSLVIIALLVALLHIFPNLLEYYRYASETFSQLLASFVPNQPHVQRIIEWAPPLLASIAAVVVSRAISGTLARLLLRPSKIELEYNSYLSFPVADEGKLREQPWEELVSFVRHAYYEVWSSKVGDEQGLPAEFSESDAHIALTAADPSRAVRKRIQYLESYCSRSRKENRQRSALGYFTDRWLGLRPGRGLRAAIVWLLCFSLLVSSLPRPVLLAATAEVKANVKKLVQKTNSQGAEYFAARELPELLGETTRNENDEFDEKKPILEAPETEDDVLDASFDANAAASDFEAFSDSAPLLGEVISGLENESDKDIAEVASNIRDSIVFGLSDEGPLTLEERRELKDDVKAAEELAKRIAAGEVSNSEARAALKDAREKLRRADELRQEAKAEEAEADRLEKQAEQAELEGKEADRIAEKGNKDANALDDAASQIDKDAQSLRDEADTLDPAGAATRLKKEAAELEAKAKERRSSAKANEVESARLNDESVSKKKEAEELERRAKEENDAAKRTKSSELRREAEDREKRARKKRELADKQKREAQDLEDEAKRKAKKATELSSKPKTDPEAKAEAERKRKAAAEKKQQAEDKRKQAEAKRKEAEKKKAEAEQKKKEAEKKKKEAAKKRNSAKKKKRNAWKLGLKAAIALAALAIHPVLGIAAIWMMLSGKDAGTGGGEGGGTGDGKGRGSGDDKSGDDKSGDDKSGDDKSGDDKSGDNKSGDNKSGDDKSGDDKSGDDKSGDDKSGDDKSGDNKPGDNKPGDNKPGDNKPGDNKPGDNKPGDNKPKDNKPKDEPSSTPKRANVPSFSGIGKDIFWEERSGGDLVCRKKEGEGSKIIGIVSSKLAQERAVRGVQYYPGAEGGSYIVVSVGSSIYRVTSKGESTALLNITLDELLNSEKKEVTDGGKRVLRLASQRMQYHVVHSVQFKRTVEPDEKAKSATAWFLYQTRNATGGELVWVLEPDDAEQRNMPIVDKSIHQAFANRLQEGKEIPDGLRRVLGVLARRSYEVSPDSVSVTVPLLSFSDSKHYRLVTAVPDGKRYAVYVYQSDWDAERVRARITARSWATLLESDGHKQIRPNGVKLLFGDDLDEKLTKSSPPKGWYDDGWTIVSAQMNIADSIAIVLMKPSKPDGVHLRFLPHSTEEERKWHSGPLAGMQSKYEKRMRQFSSDYKGKHGSVKFSTFEALEPAVIDAWVIQGDDELNRDYPAWAKDNKEEVGWLFIQDN